MGVGRAKKKTDAARCTSEFELGWPKNYRVSFCFDSVTECVTNSMMLVEFCLYQNPMLRKVFRCAVVASADMRVPLSFSSEADEP